MSRALLILALVLLLALAGCGLMLFLAYGFEAGVPGQARVTGLRAPTQIDWHDDGPAVVEAQSEADAYAALGYVHGLRQGWNVVLWRQAATGRLAEWFGDDALPVDRLVQRLGLATMARDAFARLPAPDQALLHAYTEGLNAALASDATTYGSAFVGHDVEPEAWEPWHTLAVERLFAWLAVATPSPDTLAFAGRDAVAFFEADRMLRRTLHVHGFEHSMALAVTDSAGTHLAQRHTFGASALPVFEEVSLHWPGAPRLVGASLPGTPFFPAGRTETHAWALLLYSPFEMVRAPDDTSAVRSVYERVVSADGTEHLVVSRRDPAMLYFDPPPPPPPAPVRPDTARAPADSLGAGPDPLPLDTPAPPPVPADTGDAPDSTWTLRWAGFQEGTDWAAWRALAAGEAPSFRLLSGSGLTLTSQGAAQVLGAPLVVHPLARGVLVGNDAWLRHAAGRLDTLLAAPQEDRSAAALLDDTYSTWAARLGPSMIEAAVAIPHQPALVTEALTYLRNWDFRYDRASIAAPIFDAWVTAYRDSLGHLPSEAIPDTLYFEHIVRYEMLVRAVDTLAARHGADLSQWRWERVQPRRFLYPGEPAPSAGPTRALRRHAPLELPGDGHPSALHWGASDVQRELLSPAYWEAWIGTPHWELLETRRYRFDLDAFFGRYLVSDRPPAARAVGSGAPPSQTTTLVPPQARP